MAHRPIAAALAVLLSATLHARAAPAESDCDVAVRARPEDLASWRCFSWQVEGGGPPHEARRKLEALRASDPRLAAPASWMLGALRGGDAATREMRLTEAVALFDRERRAAGSVHARVDLAELLRVRSRGPEAARLLDEAARVAAQANDRRLELLVDLERARLASSAGRFTVAWELGQAVAQDPVFDELWAEFRMMTYGVLSGAARALGLYGEALDLAGHGAGVARAEGWPQREALLLNGASLAGAELVRRGRLDRDVAASFARRGLELARSEGAFIAELDALTQLARLAEESESLELWEALVAQSRRYQCWSVTAAALANHAVRSSRLHPDRRRQALAEIAEAIELTGDRDPYQTALSLAGRATILRAGAPRDEAITASLEALERIEALRQSQAGDELRARFVAEFAEHYHGFAEWLLPDDPGLAFEVGERLRTRSLLDYLDRLDAGPAEGSPAAETVSIETVRRALDHDEALLVFSLPSGVEHSGWLVAVTRDGARAYPLGRSGEVGSAVELWRGLVERRDGLDLAAGESLYRALLADALRELPPAITRLIVVPDGPLHGLPFGALRAAGERTVLAERFEIAVSPSATLWSRLRDGLARSPAPRATSVLVVADPWRSRPAWLPAAWRGDPGALAPLPQARAESREVLRAFGGRGTLLQGRRATERALGRVPLDAYGVLHFATHAIVDEALPARSAILLARTEPDDDGRLEPAEVLDLDLGGALVVLSACRSARGPHVAGEGPLSLARAFFQAGAATVVATLWPLRDDEAAPLVSSIYRELGAGRSVAEALARAQRRAIAAGAPTAAWAGVVALGAGDLVPVPEAVPAGGGRSADSNRVEPRLLAVLVVAAALLVGAAAFALGRSA